jgi:spore germination protein GerM
MATSSRAPSTGLALSGLAAATLLTGCAGNTPVARSETPAPGGSSSSATGSSIPTSSGSPAAQSSAARRAVAVYYLADTGATGPRLYREFHLRLATSAVVRDAVDAMLHEAPYDADYRSPWPRDTRILGVAVAGDLATVNLSHEALRGSAGSAFEVASLQQLVWTVTGAAPAVQQVRVLIEGRNSGTVDGREIADFWGAGGLATQPLRRGPQGEVLGPVWILAPATGATVGADLAISGTESVFEGTVSWEVRSGSTLVKRGFVTGVGAPERGSWSAKVRLAPGSYVVRAFESSAKDGSVTFLDDKPFRVG